MARKKAAIQMSLGLIVAVVFAVVLLTLTITWIQGMIGDISSITHDLTNQAQTKLQDTFAETSTTFAIWPTHYELSPGDTVKLSAGIKNAVSDGQRHDFVLNVVPAGASNSICPGGDVNDCGGHPIADEMASWATVERTVSSIAIQSTAYKSITIEIPPSTLPGSYIFNVVSCYDRTSTGSIVTPSSFACEGNSDNIWSNAASLTIQVTS
jgi:hypothetical protein